MISAQYIQDPSLFHVSFFFRLISRIFCSTSFIHLSTNVHRCQSGLQIKKPCLFHRQRTIHMACYQYQLRCVFKRIGEKAKLFGRNISNYFLHEIIYGWWTESWYYIAKCIRSARVVYQYQISIPYQYHSKCEVFLNYRYSFFFRIIEYMMVWCLSMRRQKFFCFFFFS